MSNNLKIYEQMRAFEAAKEPSVIVRKIYIDVAGGDLKAGALLSQIDYWHMPSKDGSTNTKLRVEKEDRLWLVKGRDEWWDEIRISPKEFDSASKKLVSLGLIVKKSMKDPFDPSKQKTKMHIRLTDSFYEKMIAYMEEQEKQRKEELESLEEVEDLDEILDDIIPEPEQNEEEDEEGKSPSSLGIPQKGNPAETPPSLGIPQKGNPGIDQRGNPGITQRSIPSITKITYSETTFEREKNNIKTSLIQNLKSYNLSFDVIFAVNYYFPKLLENKVNLEELEKWLINKKGVYADRDLTLAIQQLATYESPIDNTLNFAYKTVHMADEIRQGENASKERKQREKEQKEFMERRRKRDQSVYYNWLEEEA